MAREQGDLRTYLKVLWRWRLLMLAILVPIPATVYLIVSSQPKVYEASVLLQVQPSAVDTTLFQNQAPAQQSQTLLSAARLVTTTNVARAAARELGEPPSRARALLGSVTAIPDVDADFITIAARAGSPERAADLANAFAAGTVSFRKNQAIGRLNATIGTLDRQLDRISGRTEADRDARKQLSEQVQRLRAVRAAQGNNAIIVEPAVASNVPVAPRVTRTVVLSAIVALLLAFGAVFLAEAADRKIRDPTELEELTDRPLLSAVPRSAFGDVDGGGAAGGEAFQRLRGSLTYFNIDRPIDSVLISSPAPGDGKTTVATNLAIAVARAGKDVILVDADLRRPDVASRFEVSPKLGLGGVLVGEVGLEEALVDYEVDAPGGWLRLLPGNPPPPNPSELLASERMERLLDQLTRMSDLVIIDSTPLLTVSDSLPLIELVSGIVAVARLNATSKDAIRRFERVVSTASGTLLGSVVTGTSAIGLYGGYGYLPESPTNGGPPPRGPHVPSPKLGWRRLGLGRLSMPWGGAPSEAPPPPAPPPESAPPPAGKRSTAGRGAGAGHGRV